jgi:hypothetical protein
MAGPWEEYQQQPATEGPWQQYAPQEKSFGEKLLETWPARLGKAVFNAAHSAVTLPGDVMSGQVAVDPSDPKFIGRTLDFATMANPLPASTRAGVGWAGAPRAPTQAAIPTREALEGAADAGYKQVRSSPFEVQASAVGDMASKIQTNLERDGILAEFAPDTFTVLKKLQSPGDATIATGSGLVSAREALRVAARNQTNAREKLAAERAIRELDQFIEAPPAASVLAGTPAEFAKTAADARANYAAAKRSETVGDALHEATLQTGSTYSGRNFDNAARQKFRQLVTNDRKSAGFSDAEIAQTERAVMGSKTADISRTLGNALGGGGGLGALHTGLAAFGAGTALGGPLVGVAAGVAAPLTGQVLKRGADASTMKQIRILDEMIRSRSPLAETMPQNLALSPAEEFRRYLLVRSLLANQNQQ